MRRRGVIIGAVSAAAMLLVSTAAAPAQAATARQRLGSVVVPAYCHMPTQQLHDGKTAEKYQPRQGSIDYHGAAPIAVHLTHRGIQLLAQYECSGGGNAVPWPSVLVLYNRHNTLLAHLPLARHTNAEHAAVTSWRADGNTVKISWVSYNGAGAPFTHHHSTLTYSRTTLRLS